MNRYSIAVAVVAMVALAGCAGLPGGTDGGDGTPVPEGEVPTEQVAVGEDAAEAENVNQTLRITVNETTAGDELTAIGATYPRDEFAVESAGHEAIVLGVDTDDDGEVDRSFNETHVSGVNTNEYSFDVTLDTGYTLQEGDVVVIGYPTVDNPDEAGDYEVEVSLNGEQRATGTITIE